MAKRPAFSLPPGLKLELTDTKMSIEFDGDINLDQDLGRTIDEIRATGDITVKLDKVTGKLFAGGTLTVMGEVAAERLHGAEVILGRQTILCRAITADKRITIGASKLAVDVIMAPEINLDPKAAGRVTVIESHNERGATKIKGGFSLADYDDMFGDAEGFLAQRGLVPLGEGPARVTASDDTLDDSNEIAGSADSSTDGANERPTLDRSDPPTTPHDEDIDDPLSLSLDDLEPLVEAGQESGVENGSDLHDRLADALGRITACYQGSDMPPAVDELRDLVEHRDYDALRQNITEVWNGLLGFHQKRGIRPHHQVTHAFNVIHGLVQT